MGDTIKRMVECVISEAKDFVFPRRCPVCDTILPWHKGKICAGCYHRLVYIKEPRCKKCGRHIGQPEQEYCLDCSRKTHWFESGIALLEHTGDGKKAVYAVKYHHRQEYVDFFTDELVRRFREDIAWFHADVLIPVPLHRKKQIRRGFNQAAVIAGMLGKKTGIPVEPKALVRTVNTKPQKECDDHERRKNLEKAFRIRKGIRLQGKNVILVDDIYTTGSTIDACAKVLKEAGAQKVYFISLSIGTD